FSAGSQSFQSYRPDGLPPDKLFIIQSMAADSSNHLWFITLGDPTVYRFDRASQQFTAFHLTPDDLAGLADAHLTTAFADSQGAVWIGGAGYLARLDPATGRFQSYAADPNSPAGLPSAVIQAIHEGPA